MIGKRIGFIECRVGKGHAAACAMLLSFCLAAPASAVEEMLQTVQESQNDQHHHVCNRVHQSNCRIENQQENVETTANDDDQQVAPPLGTSFRNGIVSLPSSTSSARPL